MDEAPNDGLEFVSNQKDVSTIEHCRRQTDRQYPASERRKGTKKKKALVFGLVMVVFFVDVMFKGNPIVDRLTHASIAAFLGARIFFKAF